MRPGLPLAAVISLLASAAAAQAPAPSPAPEASAAAKPAGADTLSGVTVMPIPKKACSSRDKDCIALVVAELKRLYPEELKRFCFAERTSAARTQIVNDQLLESLNGNNPSIPVSSQVSPVIKIACAPDPPTAKK